MLEEDKYLLEVNLEDLETTNGEGQEYWLLAIRAAREACRLRRTRENASAAENSNGIIYMASPPRLTRRISRGRGSIIWDPLTLNLGSANDGQANLFGGADKSHN